MPSTSATPCWSQPHEARGEIRLRQLLGGFGDRVTLDWSSSTQDRVALRVQADSPRFLLPGLGGLDAIRHVDRTVSGARGAAEVISGRTPDYVARLRGDSGAIGGIEVLPFGVLIFVVGSLLVANAWAVVDTKFMVTGTPAREAVRAYVEAPDQGTGMARARVGVADTIDGQGRNPNHAHVRVDHDHGRAWGRWFALSQRSAIASRPSPCRG